MYDSNLLPDEEANRDQPIIAGRFKKNKDRWTVQNLHNTLEFLLEKIKSFLDIFEILPTGENNFT